MLSYILYSSRRKSNCTDVEIANILEACARNNSHTHVTGVLLYSDSKFIQYMEGDFQTINNLYAKIKQDDRHDRVISMAIGQIKDRLFPTWAMGAKPITDNGIQFKSPLSTDEAQVYHNLLEGNPIESPRVVDVLQKFVQ